MSPDFEIPSLWKANVSVGWDLTRTFRFGFDALAFQDEEGLAFRDIRSRPLIVDGAQALTPDGRIRYDGLNTSQHNAAINGGHAVTSTNPGSNRDIEAYNGEGSPLNWVAAVSLSAVWDNGVEAGISYAQQNIEEFSNTARFSSTASSLYGGQFASFDPNTAIEGRSQEEISDSVKYNFGWRHNFVGDLATRFTLFGEWRTGRPVSFTMSGGTGRNAVFGVNRGAQLAYVPDLSGAVTTTTGISQTNNGVTTANGSATTVASDSLVSFDSATTIAQLQDMIERFDIPTGGIVPRGSYDNADIHRLDLQVSQELPGFFQNHRTLLTFDIANVLNLINDEWGVVTEYPEDFRLFNVTCAGTDGVSDDDGQVTCGRYRISGVNTNQSETRNTDASRWAIQVGLRYQF
jgi:hypothetical protein